MIILRRKTTVNWASKENANGDSLLVLVEQKKLEMGANDAYIPPAWWLEVLPTLGIVEERVPVKLADPQGRDEIDVALIRCMKAAQHNNAIQASASALERYLESTPKMGINNLHGLLQWAQYGEGLTEKIAALSQIAIMRYLQEDG